MDKDLYVFAAAACLGAATAVHAQSSVTLEGVVDVGVQRMSAGGMGSVTAVGNSGLTTSRLIFRGTEDLGGGLRANFWLESGLNPDNGSGRATNTNNQTSGVGPGSVSAQGLTFDRRAYTGLAGRWGELRVGRDFIPSQYMSIYYDAFNTNGVARAGNFTYSAAANGPFPSTVAISNSVGYWTPSGLGGFYAQAMLALGENPSNAANSHDGNVRSIRAGYGNGPFDVSGAYSRTSYVATAASGDYTHTGIGGTWSASFAKFFALYEVARIQLSTGTVRKNVTLIGVQVPVHGNGIVRGSYGRLDDRSSASLTNTDRSPRSTNDAHQLALGYVYYFSKRTAAYATYARITNNGQATYPLNGSPTPVAGGSSRGAEVGLRHSF